LVSFILPIGVLVGKFVWKKVLLRTICC